MHVELHDPVDPVDLGVYGVNAQLPRITNIVVVMADWAEAY